jgi:uncharacterized membrane protein YbhN (UPF0104 family)
VRPTHASRLWWTVGAVGFVVALRTCFLFPWRGMLAALVEANPWLLMAAAAINLLSPACKGMGWYALLRRLAPCRLWVVQLANLMGAAVGSLTIGPTGEAARIAFVVERDGVTARVALLSVAASRVTEALALAVFVTLAPFLLDLPFPMRTLQLGAALLLAVLCIGGQAPVRTWLVNRLPAAAQRIAGQLAEVGGGPRLRVPVAYGLASWTAEWLVYHLVLRATLGPISCAASFAALIAVNLGGVLRLTPGNAGVLQAAVAAGLAPFGVPVWHGVAAGLALQGVQTLPILLLCVPFVARRPESSAATVPVTE